MRERARPDLWEPRVSNHPRPPGLSDPKLHQQYSFET